MSMETTDHRAVRRGHKVKPLEPLPAPADPVLAGVVGTVEQAERQRLAWAQTLDGEGIEQITSASLDLIGRYGWTSIHVARWPGLPDVHDVHVAIGPGGFVVVAERAWAGRVVVEGDVLRHDGFRCERDVEALQSAMAALATLLSQEHRAAISGVIHVTPRDFAPACTAGIVVVGRLHLASLLVDMPQRLTPMDVADIARWLTRAIEVPVTPLVNSGGAAMSSGTVFYPTGAGSSETASYFVPRQLGPGGAAVLPSYGVPPSHESDEETWALLYPRSNRFGIR